MNVKIHLLNLVEIMKLTNFFHIHFLIKKPDKNLLKGKCANVFNIFLSKTSIVLKE